MKIRQFLKQITKPLWEDEINSLIERISEDTDVIFELSDKINKLEYPNPKERYYNNKYPKKNIFYNRVEKKKTYRIDVRQFLNPNNSLLPKFTGTDDEIALKGLKWVIKNIRYTPDKRQYGLNEYWAFGFETLKNKAGDCEDGGILLYDILRNSGIPYWKLRVNAGWVINPHNKKREGHAYLVYYTEEADKWVILDWCYYPNTKKIKEREKYKNNKIYDKIWFSFNERFAYSKTFNQRDKPIKQIK